MSYQIITPLDAKALIEKGELNIADIRDAMNFSAGHICRAQHVDNANLQDFMAQASPTQPLLVCCYHGMSSRSAAEFFAQQGYQEVYSLDGGYEMWKLAFPELCEA